MDESTQQHKGMVTVTFHPQAWVNDNAIEADPEGPTQWLVPESRVAGLEPDTYPSDELRYDDEAPQWVKDWSGPFYIDWN